MEDVIQLIVFLIAGGIGLVQWLQKRRQEKAKQAAADALREQNTTGPAPPRRAAVAPRTHARPAMRRRAPARVPSRTAPHRPARSSPYDELDHADAQEELTLENVLSEIFGGEPVAVPPRPPARVPVRPAPPAPTPPPIAPAEAEEAPQPLPPAVSGPPAPPAPASPPVPATGILHTLRGLRGTDWQLAVVMHEVLGPPAGLR